MRIRHVILLAALAIAACLAVREFYRDRGPLGSYAVVESHLLRLNTSTYARTRIIGHSVRGRPIYAVVITDPRSRLGLQSRVRLLFISAQHGMETAPILPVLDVIDRLAGTRSSNDRAILRRAVLVFVPIVNPDGFEAVRRCNESEVDLNRDWGGRTQPETQAADHLAQTLNPHVFVDLHEGRPNSTEVSPTGGGRKTGLAMELAQTAALSTRDWRLQLTPFMCQPNRAPSLAHRHFARLGICSMLLESTCDLPASVRRPVYYRFISHLIATTASPESSYLRRELTAYVRARGRTSLDLASIYREGVAVRAVHRGRRDHGPESADHRGSARASRPAGHTSAAVGD